MKTVLDKVIEAIKGTDYVVNLLPDNLWPLVANISFEYRPVFIRRLKNGIALPGLLVTVYDDGILYKLEPELFDFAFRLKNVGPVQLKPLTNEVSIIQKIKMDGPITITRLAQAVNVTVPEIIKKLQEMNDKNLMPNVDSVLDESLARELSLKFCCYLEINETQET